MAQRDEEHPNDGDLALQDAKPEVKQPTLFKVILLNDDFTPMDFVVEILIDFFSMTEEDATQIMLHVHTRGVGICGVYSRDIAETKVQLVNEHSQQCQHPLLCAMEEA